METLRQWIAVNGFAYGVAIVGVIALIIYLIPDVIKRRF